MAKDTEELSYMVRKLKDSCIAEMNINIGKSEYAYESWWGLVDQHSTERGRRVFSTLLNMIDWDSNQEW